MNLINVEGLGKAYGPVPLLDGVSLGVEAGDRIGVVGRNGDGKTTLLSVLAGSGTPDTGRVTHTPGAAGGVLTQHDALDPAAHVRRVVLGERAEHEWAGDARSGTMLAGLLGRHLDLDARSTGLSGGERRRIALAQLLVDEHDLIILDEPTNHLDIEAIAWLGRHLPDATARWSSSPTTGGSSTRSAPRRGRSCDGQGPAYEGGYSAYVLAKAERTRIAAAAEETPRRT